MVGENVRRFGARSATSDANVQKELLEVNMAVGCSCCVSCRVVLPLYL